MRPHAMALCGTSRTQLARCMLVGHGSLERICEEPSYLRTGPCFLVIAAPKLLWVLKAAAAGGGASLACACLLRSGRRFAVEGFYVWCVNRAFTSRQLLFGACGSVGERSAEWGHPHMFRRPRPVGYHRTRRPLRVRLVQVASYSERPFSRHPLAGTSRRSTADVSQT